MDEDSANNSPKTEDNAPPSLAALFLIRFDLKVGYTVAWKQSLPDIPLEGIVEYKSLPSGLHNVTEDLVYFVYEDWAGVSAFRNAEAEEGERGARFISVGALVRIGDGRLGRAWEHAGALKELATTLVDNPGNTSPLNEYWEQHKDLSDQNGEASKEPVSPFTEVRRRNRGLSSSTLAPSHQTLPPYHPAYSILEYLDTFGPLVFPLHRAALLRKRILIITPPPVKLTCEYDYDISLLSSLPHSLSYNPIPPTQPRLRPLFNLGIHDIPYLSSLKPSPKPQTNGHPTNSDAAESEESESEAQGWIASTTDEILAMKTDLYDILVELPHPDRYKPIAGPGRRPKNKGVGVKRWPVITVGKSGEEIKATQRDLRRYRSLRRALLPLTKMHTEAGLEGTGRDDDDDEETHLLFEGKGEYAEEEEAQQRADEEKVTEKMSWSEVAYSSFMWWASAGEREEGVQAEDDQDAALLSNLPDIVRAEVEQRRYRDEDGEEDEDEETDESPKRQAPRGAEIEMGIIAYFYRVSKQIFDTSESFLTDGDTEDEDEEEALEDDRAESGRLVKLDAEDLRRCGLDVWSESERKFIKEFVELWFGREVELRGVSIECCGVKIC